MGEQIKAGRWYKLDFNPFTDVLPTKDIVSGNYAIINKIGVIYLGESANLAVRINAHATCLNNYIFNRRQRFIFKMRIEKNGERKQLERRLISRLKPRGNGPFRGNGIKQDIGASIKKFIICDDTLAQKRKTLRTVFKRKHRLSDKEEGVLRMRMGLIGDGSRPLTLQDISDILGVSRERVRQIERRAWKKAMPCLNSSNLINIGLPQRVINCLGRCGLKTFQELKEFVDLYGYERLYHIPNFGRQSMKEVRTLIENTSHE